MFILNFKVNGKRIWKIIVAFLIILIIALLAFVIFRIFNSAKSNSISNNPDVIEISSEEYTNFLKKSHEDIESYNGKKIKVVGYVYRLPDFSTTEFVIARTMVINNPRSSVVVGLLAEYKDATKFETGSWVEATGTIKIGNYNGSIPVLEISDIKTTTAPKDEFVYLPVD